MLKRITDEIERLKFNNRPFLSSADREQAHEAWAKQEAYNQIRDFINSLEKELLTTEDNTKAFKEGVKWHKEKIKETIRTYALGALKRYNKTSGDVDYWNGKYTACVDLIDTLDREQI